MPVTIAEADLPVRLRGVTRRDHQVRLVVVKQVDQGLGRVVGAFQLFGLAAAILLDVLVLYQFVVPLAFGDHFGREFRARGDFLHDQRLTMACYHQRVIRVVASENAPERVGVGIVVQLAGQLVNLLNEVAGRLGGLSHKACVARKLPLQRIERLVDRRVVHDDRYVVFRLQRGDYFFPLGVHGSRFLHHHGIGIFQRRCLAGGGGRLPGEGDSGAEHDCHRKASSASHRTLPRKG